MYSRPHREAERFTAGKQLMERWTTVLNIHHDLTVAVSAVLTEPFDCPLFVETVRPDEFKSVAQAMIAAAFKVFVNPIEQNFQLILGRG